MVKQPEASGLSARHFRHGENPDPTPPGLCPHRAFAFITHLLSLKDTKAHSDVVMGRISKALEILPPPDFGE